MCKTCAPPAVFSSSASRGRAVRVRPAASAQATSRGGVGNLTKGHRSRPNAQPEAQHAEPRVVQAGLEHLATPDR